MNTNTQRMVKVRSTCTGRFVINEPAFNLVREFPTKGSVQMIPYEAIEQLLWQPGFKTAIDTGMIYIDDMQDKIDLGLESPEAKAPERIRVLSEAQMLKLLKVDSYEVFANDITGLPIEQARALVHFAADNNIIDMKKIDTLKAVTGLDAIKIIAAKRANEEADRMIAEKEARARQEGDFNPV